MSIKKKVKEFVKNVEKVYSPKEVLKKKNLKK